MGLEPRGFAGLAALEREGNGGRRAANATASAVSRAERRSCQSSSARSNPRPRRRDLPSRRRRVEHGGSYGVYRLPPVRRARGGHAGKRPDAAQGAHVRGQTRGSVPSGRHRPDFATRAQRGGLGANNQTGAKTAGLHPHTAVDDAHLRLGLLRLEFDASRPGKVPEERESELRGQRAEALDGKQLVGVTGSGFHVRRTAPSRRSVPPHRRRHRARPHRFRHSHQRAETAAPNRWFLRSSFCPSRYQL